MAEKINRDPFTPWLNGFSYETAFDGAVWVLKRGEDFEHAPSTVAASLRDEYSRRYGRLDVKVDGDSVVIRRVPGASA